MTQHLDRDSATTNSAITIMSAHDDQRMSRDDEMRRRSTVGGRGLERVLCMRQHTSSAGSIRWAHVCRIRATVRTHQASKLDQEETVARRATPVKRHSVALVSCFSLANSNAHNAPGAENKKVIFSPWRQLAFPWRVLTMRTARKSHEYYHKFLSQIPFRTFGLPLRDSAGYHRPFFKKFNGIVHS